MSDRVMQKFSGKPRNHEKQKKNNNFKEMKGGFATRVEARLALRASHHKTLSSASRGRDSEGGGGR